VSREVALVATIAAGGLVALQAPLNGMLGRAVGPFAAATVNFTTGLILLLLITFVFAGGFHSNDDPAPWYAWVFGGLLGAAYVTTALVAVRSLGAGGVTAATIAGQLTLSLVADRLGIFGLEERDLTPTRVLGVVLLVVGTLLVVRD
jgi:bacterial/archaeal transporter family-2 protein